MKKRQQKKLEKIKKLVEKAEDARKKIYEKIMKIPQNPDINEISKNPACWEINSKNLTADMMISPSYYNFKIQCANIVRYLDKKPISKFAEAIEEITTPDSNGNCILKGQEYAYRIHPKVAQYLKEIL